MKRRDMITMVSLDLFNNIGESNLSAMDIANELDISPGNLYYHFKGKEQIIAGLFSQFEEKIKRVFSVEDEEESDSLTLVWLHLYVFLELLYAYRFLFRNVDDIVQRYPATGKKLIKVISQIRQVIVGGITLLAENSIIKISASQSAVLGRIANNITLVLLYWGNYLFVQAGEPGKEHFVEEASLQILSLLSPYLDEAQIISLKECYIAYAGKDS